jgi:hypothetical protein
MVVAKPETKKISYPMFPQKAWWTLRKIFYQRLPGEVDGDYLASVLGMQLERAQDLVSPLRKMGLIDENGKTTDRANNWRFNEEYKAVCEEIRQEIYPQKLLDAFHDPASISRTALENRFKNDARVGDSAAKQMAILYLLLLRADPSEQDAATNSAPKQPAKGNRRQSAAAKASVSAAKQVVQANGHLSNAEESTPHQTRHTRDNGPSLHVNIQVHISPDASTEQIDHTLASMAKHFATFFRQDHE